LIRININGLPVFPPVLPQLEFRDFCVTQCPQTITDACLTPQVCSPETKLLSPVGLHPGNPGGPLLPGLASCRGSNQE
jgi:hypothetical protein